MNGSTWQVVLSLVFFAIVHWRLILGPMNA
jgi:hypothetical protein